MEKTEVRCTAKMDAKPAELRATWVLTPASLFLVVLVSLTSFFYVLQRYGVYDYFDGIRYLANGVSLLNDGIGSPIPVEYHSGVNDGSFIGQNQLSYPSVVFQIWSALTAGWNHPSLLWVAAAGSIVFTAHNLLFFMLARQFVPWLLAIATVVFLCINPFDNLLVRSSARPLPDGMLLLASTGAVYLSVIGKPVSSAVVASLGCIVRFQGVLFLWVTFLLAKSRRDALAFIAVWSSIFIFGSILLNAVMALHTGGSGDQNAGFYTKILQNQSWLESIEKFPSDLMVTLGALFSTRAFLINLLLTPFVLVGHWLSEDSGQRRFLVFSLVMTYITSFISFHALTVAAGSGQDPRYLIYTLPIMSLAAVMSCKLISDRLSLREVWLPVFLLTMSSIYFVNSVRRLPSFQPFWQLNYLPEVQLSRLPSNSIIAIFGAEESGPEIYSATRARHLIWLPKDPKLFGSNSNPEIDFLVIGGYWSRGTDEPWIDFAKSGVPLIDASGTRFEYHFKTEYYWIYKRQS